MGALQFLRLSSCIWPGTRTRKGKTTLRTPNAERCWQKNVSQKGGLKVHITGCSTSCQVGGFMAIWGGYTFVLGFLIVFRNNQAGEVVHVVPCIHTYPHRLEAYNRFWEAASKMHELRGELFNCASTLCAYCCEPTTLEMILKYPSLHNR